MKELPTLSHLNMEDKDALIMELWAEVQRLRQEISGQKAVKKTSENSSLPPSSEIKENIEPSKTTKKKGERHKNGGRKLDSEPSQIITAQAKICPHCQSEVEIESQKLQAVYEKIELPKIVPIITQVRQYGGKCPHCEEKYVAAVPVGMEQGSPFDKSIETLAIYLRYSHFISYERLSQMMGEVYGVKISEGGLAELFKRVKTRLDPQVEAILERLQRSRLVCSDETSAPSQWQK